MCPIGLKPGLKAKGGYKVHPICREDVILLARENHKLNQPSRRGEETFAKE